MKLIGRLLFGAGFLAGAFFLVQLVDDVNWTAYGVSTTVCLAGVVLMRLAERTDTSAKAEAETNLQIVIESLARLTEKVGDISARREEIGVYGIHTELDETLIDDLNAFVGAREAITHQRGLETYARVMDAFAAGERALNRAWSASADGYIDEVWACLDRAERALARAQRALAEDGMGLLVWLE